MSAKTKPLISVVIPAFNEEKYIGRCLKSLKIQSFRRFEIIVVDNNSTDKTGQIASSFGAKVIREKRQGTTFARDKGFAYAHADIISRTDADSIVPRNWLNRIFLTFKYNPKLAALTGGIYIKQKNKLQNIILQKFMDSYMANLKLIMGHFPLNGPNFALRKAVLKDIRVHENDAYVHEDIDLSCHISEKGEIRYIRNLKVFYSLRRWKRKFWATMFNYSKRTIQTINLHHPKLKRHTIPIPAV